MDTPQLTPALLVAAVRTLVAPAERRSDACLGPATDGGWWLLGLRRPDPDLLLGLPMSVPTTGEATRRRLDEAGLSVVELPRLRDVDTADDARAVAAGVPGSCFARVHDHLTRVAS
jgi:glycosyltransferase A (GT-A) superfamily protein (DUF2064 family)